MENTDRKKLKSLACKNKRIIFFQTLRPNFKMKQENYFFIYNLNPKVISLLQVVFVTEVSNSQSYSHFKTFSEHNVFIAVLQVA